MQIFTICKPLPVNKRLKKTIIIMKLTTLLMILGCMHLNAAVFSQNINLAERNESLKNIFSKMEKQSGYTFFYHMELIEAMPKVNVNMKNVTLDEALSRFLSKLSLSYVIVDKVVVIQSIDHKLSPNEKLPPRIYLGRVLNEKGDPLPGATIKVKGTKQTFVANEQGRFITTVIEDPKTILQISYLGYETMEVTADELDNKKDLQLRLSTSDLDQVQVIAYGTTTKRISTGNTTTITSSEIAKSPARNVLEVMQGQVPGLFVRQLSGLPGSPFNLMIRGQQTISSGFRSSQPLIIVDGVALPAGVLPLNQNNATRENLTNQLKGGNPLDYIDPSIIESITVLKDADATSIYGSRGAYGVILITTKKGKAGKPQLSVNTSTGVTVRGTAPDLLNTEQYVMLRKEALKNDGTTLGVVDDINGPNADRYTDFQKILAGNKGIVNRVNANYSGGTQDLTFLIGGNYRKQTSIQIGKGSTRDGGLNFSLSNNIKNKFSMTLSGSFLSTTDDAVPYDFSQGNAATLAPNSAPFFLPDGSLNWETNSNPASAMNIIFKNVTNNLFTNLALKYTPVKGLSINTNIGYNNMNSKALNALPSSYFQPGTAFKTTSTLNLYNVRNITVNPNVSYFTDLGAKGKLTLTAGSTLQNELSYQSYVTGNDFLSDDMLYNPSFADPLTATGTANITSFYNQSPNKRLNFIGIVNYNWDNKYILNLNGNRDGSTKFGPDSRFGNFGSVGAAWIFSRENWFAHLPSIITFAKLRGSIGTAGGDGIDNYGYLATYSKGNSYEGSLGLRADALANNDLHWEKNRKTEGGLTIELLNGRFTADASYFDTKTTDQLVAQILPTTTGFGGRQVNSPAEIRNWGWEFELSSTNIRKKDFAWTSRLNVTIPKNKLVAYPGLGTIIVDVNYMVGKPVQGIRVYNYAGVNPETGLYNFINRDGVQDSYRVLLDQKQLDVNLDKTEFIDLTPKFYGGLSNSFNYKAFSLDVFFTFTERMGRNFLGSQSFPPGFVGTNLSTVALQRWQKEGDITPVAKAGAGLSAFFSQGNFITSTGAYSDAFYARLSTVNLSYTLPVKFAQQLHLAGFSVFGQGANLLTISKYGDLDPENLGAGMAPLRNFTAGLRVQL